MTNYNELNSISKSFFDGITEEITILSNASALLNDYLDDINWVGFYLYRNNQLILGPFQGKIACMQIKIGKGVCGTAAMELKTKLVKNVHEFPGHIACDFRSNSEIVIPLMVHNSLYGVLDIDSTSLARFTIDDQTNLEEFAQTICKLIENIID